VNGRHRILVIVIRVLARPVSHAVQQWRLPAASGRRDDGRPLPGRTVQHAAQSSVATRSWRPISPRRRARLVRRAGYSSPATRSSGCCAIAAGLIGSAARGVRESPESGNGLSPVRRWYWGRCWRHPADNKCWTSPRPAWRRSSWPCCT